MSTLTFAQIALTSFWAITFLQSGLDKIFDWSGNLSWLKGHFEKSPLSGIVPLLLGILTLVEVGAGIISVIGVTQILVNGDLSMAQYGVQLATTALVMLFFGQRMSKDYEGAATITSYFAVALISLYLIS